MLLRSRASARVLVTLYILYIMFPIKASAINKNILPIEEKYGARPADKSRKYFAKREFSHEYVKNSPQNFAKYDQKVDNKNFLL